MTSTALSKNGVPIRLADERWAHITDEHSELGGLRLEVLEAVMDPIRIVEGADGELLAVARQELGKYIVVVYREPASDGFVITAFLTGRMRSLERRKQIWP